ncbi:MAG: hypothetical protein GY719_40975 [bacterium]|nr:hypothetical protein [bacterium]
MFSILRFARLTACLSLLLPSIASAAPPDVWLAGRDWSLESDPTYQISYDRGATPWLVARQQGDIVHLLFEFPPRIMRYDMAAESWLTDISLGAVPSAMAVDGDGIYVAFGADVRGYALDGTGETSLRTAAFSVNEMLVDGSYLFLAAGNDIESVDKTTGGLIDSSVSWFYSMQGLSISPATDRIYARSTGVSPSDIVVVDYASDGTLGNQDDSIYHGDYPNAVQTWVYPAADRVADNSGVVYTGGLDYSGSLAGSFDDLAFHASGPILLRGAELHAHDANGLETGRFTLSEAVASIFVRGDSIYGFHPDVAGAGVIEVAKSSLVPPVPGPPVDPTGLAYAPDQILIGTDGIVYLLSKLHLSIFRWSLAAGGYIETIPLVEEPLRIAYSASNGRIYLAYPNGRVSEIDVTTARGPVGETPLLNSPQQPCGLSTAGPWIFLCDPSGAWVSHFTYSPAGLLVSQEEWNYFSHDYVWSAANSKMYHLRDNTSPNDVLWEDIDPLTGEIGDQMDSPEHSSTGMIHPIRVHPEGFIVMLGSGRYHEALSLDLLEELGTGYVDAQWFGSQLQTLHAAGANSELRTWNDLLSIVVSSEITAGAPLRLLSWNGAQVVVTDVAGVPRIQVVGTPIFVDGFESGDTSAW